MNKKEFNKVVKATGKDFRLVEFESGNEVTYALYEGDELVYHDTAFEDIYNKETAIAFYAQCLLEDEVKPKYKQLNNGQWELKPVVKVSGIKKAVSELKNYRYGKAFLNMENGKIEVVETETYASYATINGGYYANVLSHSMYTNPATIKRMREALEDLAHDYEYDVIIEF